MLWNPHILPAERVPTLLVHRMFRGRMLDLDLYTEAVLLFYI